MRLQQIIILCISCKIISAQQDAEQLGRQLKLTYDDDFEIRLGEPSIPRYARWQDNFDIEMQEMLRRDLFKILRDMNKKDKEKEVSGGGGSNNEGGSGGGDAPKEEDPANCEHGEDSSSQETEVGLTFDDIDNEPESE